jgi:succinoglycan biosynthesis transport protein ExoP
MLQSQQARSVQGLDVIGEAAGAPSEETFQSVLSFVRRQYLVIAGAAAVMIALALVYVLTAPPGYTATATVLIDSQNVHLFQQQQSMFSDLPVDTGTVDSQVEIAKSENIALAVIKQLHLTEDPEFVGPGGGLVGAVISTVTGLFASKEPVSQYDLTRQAVRTFENRLSVRRVGLTYVIQIGFLSRDPGRAAQIANAVAGAYINDQLDAKYQAARRAGTWLQDRLRELREQAASAQRAVVAFRNKNNIVDAGGRSINQQQLAELNSELVLIQSKTAESRARLDRVQSILTTNSPESTVDATVTDTLKNDVITKLRSQYLELAAREGEWAAKYGINHLAVVNLRNQMSELQKSIRQELQRTAETYKSDLQISEQREKSVQHQLDQAIAQSQVTGQAQVALRELESNAQTYQALYDNFLQRYMESVQQQSFPVTETRVITAASRPLSPDHPRTRLILALAAVVGLAFGFAGGAWRDLADRVFRTRNQVETILQTDCIALVPLVKNKTEEITTVGAARETPKAKDPKPAETFKQVITIPPGMISTIIDSPLSAFAESIRAIKVAIDLGPVASGGKVIGFTSSVPNEGKSGVAAALARLMAHTGAKTVLVDCDLRNPTLSRTFSPGSACGLLEMVKGPSTAEQALWFDLATGMHFLPAAMKPAVMKARLADSSEILASEQMRRIFETLRGSYDYVIADFAPLMPVVDVRASTNLVDGYVYVVEWGRTSIATVEQSLQSARGVYEHLLGVVLNKVNLRALGRFDGQASGYYYNKNYARYGYTE